MKQFLSLFMFGIGGLFFLVFFTTLKPTVVTAASGPGKPDQCSTKAPSSLACHSLIFASARWPDVGRKQ
jgi:hypothetical protein